MATQYISIPLSAIVIPEWKIKIHNADKLEKFLMATRKYGQRHIVDMRSLPNNMYEAITNCEMVIGMKQAGLKQIVVVNHGAISEVEAKRIAVETELHQFEIDKVDFAVVLKELSTHFRLTDLAEMIPLTMDELETYCTLPDFDWDDLIRSEEAKLAAYKLKKEMLNGNNSEEAATSFPEVAPLQNYYLFDE